MPFRTEFDAVFDSVRRSWDAAAIGESVDCYWLKDRHGAGQITDEIVEGLGTSTFCVADLSGNNPNVMWETGYAMALGRPVILIGQTIDSIPFDPRDHRLLRYDITHLDQLETSLIKAIQQTVTRFRLSHIRQRPAHLYWLGHDLARAIRLAMHEDHNRVELEKCLLFGLNHLDQIELPAKDSRELLLRALARCRKPAPFTAEERSRFVGWIAQAKNDLGDGIAMHQPGFMGYPTALQRTTILEEAEKRTPREE